MVFQSNTTSKIQNEIVGDLSGTRYKLLTQTVPFIIKPVDVRFNCSFPPNLESLTTTKLNDFSVFQKNTRKTYKTTYYTFKL